MSDFFKEAEIEHIIKTENQLERSKTYDVVGLPFADYAKCKSKIVKGTTLRLKKEPTNKYDPNAIAVYFIYINADEILIDYKIGYISKDQTQLIDFDVCKVDYVGLKYIRIVEG